jgi:dTDP-4-amino-4,6-dideoxygalactose transaminase
VATTTAILWEKCEPVFVDINQETFCIDADLIEAKVTERTSAILATHVYGYPCDIEKIEAIAKKYNLKVIYDAAHCFGVKYKGQSIFNYGDISVTSFHATKLFHTIEGGGIFTQNTELMEKARLLHQFGHVGDDYFSEGTNAKSSEFQAAMGLCNLPTISEVIGKRKVISQTYKNLLEDLSLKYPQYEGDFEYNYSYFPVIFDSEELLLKIKNKLAENNINTRRYFYPSLNTLPYIKNHQTCKVSEDIAKRVLCLPLFLTIKNQDIISITDIIRQSYE